ncbi:MAG: PIN domain nuclease [Candidatus Competibacteraceae bacterium]|nr:PIN domain nuclease [Candidatus Competibacteraceae bacterium]MBK8751914.1 PIN domain nuclease [Candidatus Competibacteraceae bacterium]
MILVDTSVWIGLLRNSDRPAVNALKRLLNSETTVALTPIILQEILQGARSDAHFATLQRYFADLPMLKPGDATATSIAAAQIYCRCRWSGVTPRSSNDCLIARLAIEQDVVLLHDNHDFETIHLVEQRLKLFTL